MLFDDLPARGFAATDIMVSPVFEISGITKSFGQTIALSDVSVSLERGTIHAVVGENGAGKSTLIKIMTGLYRPSAGSIRVNGIETVFESTRDAQMKGIAAIYQEPMVFPDLDVAENIFISHINRPSRINWSDLYAEAERIVSRLGVRIDVRRLAASLTLAEQQTVEIARAISLDVQVLIMDEPSSSLSGHEVQRLFAIARALRDDGVSVLYISHRLEEIFAIADQVTVIRDGRHIDTSPVSSVTHDILVSRMVGRDMAGRFARGDSHATGEVMLQVRGLSRGNAFRDVSFHVERGEIVCFSGLVGAGRTDLALAIFGIAPAATGTIAIDGEKVNVLASGAAKNLGIAYVSEDRRKLGIAMSESVTSNITLATLADYAGRLGIIDRASEHRDASDGAEWRNKLDIKAANLDAAVGDLSGGNQQKVMLAKWLNAHPRILIVDEPTRGIDIGAKAEVHKILRSLASRGVAVMIISSDLPEVLSLADRVLVMREGRLVGEFSKESATEESVMHLALGSGTIQDAA